MKENISNEKQNQQSCKTDVSSSYDWLKNQNYAYILGTVMFPVKVEIVSLDFENELALHAAPTLIKIEVASLFNYVIKPSDDVNEIICDYINEKNK